jgi:hypothetical protein
MDLSSISITNPPYHNENPILDAASFYQHAKRRADAGSDWEKRFAPLTRTHCRRLIEEHLAEEEVMHSRQQVHHYNVTKMK